MECPIQSRENAEILLAYCDRKLDPDLLAQLERHAEDCPACHEILSAQRAVWLALDHWDAAEISADFDRRLFDRIERERAGAWWKWFLQPATSRSMRPAMAVAAACLILLAGVLLRAPGELEPAQQRATETLEIDQVENTLEDMEMLHQLGMTLKAESSAKRPI